MTRKHITLVCSLALIGALTGCSRAAVPNVTTTPGPVNSTPPTVSVGPEASRAPATATVPPSGAGENGLVDGTPGVNAGNTTRNAINGAGNTVGNAVRGTGRAIERAGEDITGMR